eukprot:GHUV01019199.1.p1 GENE.GHUV01019199.1~~GHUV01019199.1.p1  ORF type:complete len:293 (+),score=90.31 GHUV01019199.1:134-1012(+)
MMRLARRLGISAQVADTTGKQVDGMVAAGLHAATVLHVEQVEYVDSEYDEDSHMLSGRDSEAGCSTPSARSVGASSLAPSTVSWSARLSSASSVESRIIPLHTPTSASLEFWEQHQDDRVLFNVGLVSQDSESQSPVPINALDLAANSEWFRCLVKHLPVLCGTDLGSVMVPCSVSRSILEQGIVRAIYGSTVELDSGNVEAVYRAADAMQVQSIVDACEQYLFETATQPGADSSVVLAVFDLAVDLHRASFTEKLACHFAAAAQRDVAHAGQLLRHMLRSTCFCNSGEAPA